MAALVTAGMMGSFPACAQEVSAQTEPKHVSVHDPSIFEDEKSGMYYVVGSHTASASSEDLIVWNALNSDYSGRELPFYGVLQETLEKPFRWAGYDDGDCAGGGYAVWAPDIIWNPCYEWEDGETGAYMLYCCTSSSWRRSCISYLVSREMNGTYTFVDTIMYSGFTKNGKPDGSSSRNTKWDNDYLNLTSLIEKGSKDGGIDEISEKWFTADGGWDHTYGPNAIDPNVFFDASGEKLYMSYGSWSGGLYLLELDPKTGEALYPGVDSVDEVSGNYVDRYFGVHLIGGSHASGEGPYIRYDKEAGYYFLYCTYGGLQAEGGYNMRLFRSKDVTGPYLDASGKNAAENVQSPDSYGIKLIGNYAFYNQIGKRAAGHNSALIASDGSRYLVYHQRFDIQPQLEAHEVRVHQQFLNEDLWPVTAVYEYRGEQPANYEDQEVAGTYEFINHGTRTNGEMLETQMVQLNEDGTVSGAISGTWEKTDSGKGYDYVTITTDQTVYKGYFFLQHKENNEPDDVMTFSAVGNDNTCIWGSMMDPEDDEMLLEMASISLKQMMPSAARENLELPSEIMGCTIVWTSENPDVIAEDGTVIPQEEDAKAVLKAVLTRGEHTLEQSFKIRVRKPPVLVCSYDFETSEDGLVPALEESSLAEAAVLTGEAAIIEDEQRGQVLSVVNSEGTLGGSYLALPADTFREVGTGGYTVAMWVKISEDTFEHSALFEADANGEYPLTRIGANLIARINANAFSDVKDSLLTTSGERGIWQHVVYTADPYGMKVYLNGELVGEEVKDISDCFKKNKGGIFMAKDVRVGSGPIWGDEDCRDIRVDNLQVYSGVLTSSEIADLAK